MISEYLYSGIVGIISSIGVPALKVSQFYV